MKNNKKSITSQLKQVSLQSLILKQQDKVFPAYHIEDVEAIKKLVASQKGRHRFKYDFEFNRRGPKPPLFIAPNALMNGRLGVYAARPIKKSAKPIGRYAGRRLKGSGEKDSLYTFQLTDDNGKLVGHIEANRLRDWTGFINHSPVSNLYAAQRTVKGVTDIYFYLEKNIKKGEQLLYNYGHLYFNDPDMKPFYIHSSDNWLSAEEVYARHLKEYLPGRYQFDKKTRHDLHLTFPSVTGFVVPAIFKCVYENKLNDLRKLLSKSHGVDLLAYACQKSRLAPNQYQQHLTALMYACYLGYEKMIAMLLAHGADPDRCMLNAGYCPFVVLMLGQGEQTVVEKMGVTLLRKMKHPYLVDQWQLSLLHYVIKRASPYLLNAVLRVFYQEEYDWLEMIYDRDSALPKHAGFDDCLQHGQFEMLACLLKYAVLDIKINKQKNIIDRINQGDFFKYGMLLEVPLQHLQCFARLLQKAALKPLIKKTKLLERVERVIKRKS